jgi:5-methylcytosine-specific restriction endonuclease McrA
MTTKKGWQDKADVLNRRLVMKVFHPVGLRARYKCEYCGFNVLSSSQAYRGRNSDHILPKVKYPALRDSFANRALACRACHTSKGQFDPAPGEPKWSRKHDLTEEERQMLIERVRAHLEPKRKKEDEAIRSAAQLLRPVRQ